MRKNARPKHAHSHYAAQQKKLCRHQVSQVCNYTKNDKQNDKPLLSCLWEYESEWHRKDKKASVQVSQPECPIVTTTYNSVWAIIPVKTEALPSWYHQKISSTGSVRKGEVIVHELENLRTILSNYQNKSMINNLTTFSTNTKAKEPSPIHPTWS